MQPNDTAPTLTDRQLQDLRNLGNGAEDAANEIEALRARASALAQRVEELETLGAEIPQLVARADKAHESELALIEKLAGLERDLAAMTTAHAVAIELGATYAARVDKLRADAARYRLLRLRIYVDPTHLILRIRDTFLGNGATVPEMLDDALDDALKGEQHAG